MKRFLRVLYLPVFVVTIVLVYETVKLPATATYTGFSHLTLAKQALNIGLLLLPLTAITIYLLVKHKRDEAAAATPARARTYTRGSDVRGW